MISEEILNKIGLSAKEISIYLALLELNTASVGDITRKIDIPRTSIYDILNKMQQKGFVSASETQGNKLYSPTNPEIIHDKLKTDLGSFKKIIPLLANLGQEKQKYPKIKLHEGLDSIKQIYEESLKLKGMYLYSYLDVSKIPDIFAPFLENYAKKRAKKNIKAYVISPYSTEAKIYEQNNEEFLRQTILIDKPWFDLYIELFIYLDKVSIINFGEYKIGITIEDHDIAHSLKNIFMLVWKTLK